MTGQIKGVTELYKLTNYGFAILKFDIIGSTNNMAVLKYCICHKLNISVNKSGPYLNDTGQMALWIGNATIRNPRI